MNNEKQKIKKINPEFLTDYKIENFKIKDSWAKVVPIVDANELTKKNIEEIVKICNQAMIYDLLFRDKLGGESYKESNAQSSIDHAVRGWAQEAYFKYLIKTEHNEVVGTIDLKSDNPEFCEIGYWASTNHSGYMTNAVKGLIGKAKIAGYHMLIAYVKFDNLKSKSVLNRAGFVFIGEEKRRTGVIRDKYILKIE